MHKIFIWENFGPMHADRCDAVGQKYDVIGLELYGKSDTYDWTPETGSSFKKITLFPNARPRGLKLLFKLIQFRFKVGRADWFLCHYDWIEIFIFACFLRLTGVKVYTMGCSKFDDWQRNSFKEAIKRFFFMPYKGAIGSGKRSKDYFCFHGFKESQVVTEYNTVSLARIRELSNQIPAPQGVDFESRDFTIVARLVPKKNMFMALDAYSHYINLVSKPRKLNICGNGILEEELKEKAEKLGISEHVIFHGFIQTKAIAELLGKTLTLILPSVEEQFGNVVIEAQAMGLPVLLSDVCGARDCLVRTGVNGFVFEPDNPTGLAWFMSLISNDKNLWIKMCMAATESSSKGDVKMFAEGVHKLNCH